MTDRTQVNIRLERQLLEELDAMALAESMDRAELARRLLRDGLKRERVVGAVRRYREGEVSAARAAEEARISLYEMLDRIHAEGIPYELDTDELDRIDATIGARWPAGVNEQAAGYPAQQTDTNSGIDDLRAQFRPEPVRWLFVGESTPAGGTHFYRANSNLFRAMREAFDRAFGEEVPSGPAFLHFFRERGAWLVDLADRPINRLKDRERASAVAAGIDRLVSVIGATRPERIFVVKASIAALVRQAAEAARFDGDLVALPFPLRKWRARFVRELTAALAPDSDSSRAPRQCSTATSSSRAHGRTQRVTAADIAAGRIRIPNRNTNVTKSLLPQNRSTIRVHFRGHEQDSRYDPHFDADRERSGVISVERAALSRLVTPNEVLEVSVFPDGTVDLK